MQLPHEAERLRSKRLPIFGNFVDKQGKLIGESKECNHAVYLETCDVENNNYVVWTWGTTFNLTREFILGWPVDRPEKNFGSDSSRLHMEHWKRLRFDHGRSD